MNDDMMRSLFGEFLRHEDMKKRHNDGTDENELMDGITNASDIAWKVYNGYINVGFDKDQAFVLLRDTLNLASGR